jgi:hypothetical protein
MRILGARNFLLKVVGRGSAIFDHLTHAIRRRIRTVMEVHIIHA